jgi:hypothetical protein
MAAGENKPRTEIDMNRLPIKEHIAIAALGTLASACTFALAVLVPLIA